jgi:hypothetical protein
LRGSAPGVRYADDYRTVSERRILEMLLLAGSAYEEDSAKALAESREALSRWIDMGLEFRSTPDGGRLFDPVEVVNLLKRLGLEGRDPYWAERYIGTGRRLVTDLAARSDDGFTVKFRRRFNLAATAPGKTVRLRAPLPLAGVHGEALCVEPFVEGATDASPTLSDGRVEARLILAGQGDVTLGATVVLPAAAASARASDGGDDPAYLKPREGLIVVTDRVAALSRRLAGPDVDPAAAVRAYWTYLLDELICGALHYDQISPETPCDWALDIGWYDCQLGSALFVALCRARGIPARVVGGHVLYRRAPTNHYWAEVWLDEGGWTPFDFLSWDLSLGGQDSQWRDHFYGRIDARMVTQRLPYQFTGSLGLPMPRAWHIVQTAADEGVEICLEGVDGRAVYSDFVAVAP